MKLAVQGTVAIVLGALAVGRVLLASSADQATVANQHINFCKAPDGQKAAYFGPAAKFGLLGSITTQDACAAAGGQFFPHLFGWMVHVYPYETDAKHIWATKDDDDGHDNMDRSAMPGMKMN